MGELECRIRLVIYRLNFSHLDFLSPAWVAALMDPDKPPMQWLLVVLVLVIVGVIWNRGASCTRDPLDRRNVFARFDLGLAAFMILLIIKLLLSVKGGITVARPMVTLLFLPYLILGLMAIGFTRYTGRGRKTYAPGFRKIGVMLGFSVVSALLAVAVILLGHARMTGGAEMLSAVLKNGAVFIGPTVKAVLRAILMHRRNIPDPGGGSGGGGGPGMGDTGAAGGIWGEIFGWGVLGLILVVVLAGLCFGIWLIARYLFSRPEQSVNSGGRWSPWAWIGRIRDAFLFFGTRLRRWLSGIETGLDLYERLLAWGRRSGLPRRPVETPLEYQSRLAGHFPELRPAFGTIVTIVNREIYGEVRTGKAQLQAGALAWKRLSRPALWPKRVRKWFFPATPG